MNNILLYLGLVDARISASEKDLPTLNVNLIKLYYGLVCLKIVYLFPRKILPSL